ARESTTSDQTPLQPLHLGQDADGFQVCVGTGLVVDLTVLVRAGRPLEDLLTADRLEVPGALDDAVPLAAALGEPEEHPVGEAVDLDVLLAGFVPLRILVAAHRWASLVM